MNISCIWLPEHITISDNLVPNKDKKGQFGSGCFYVNIIYVPLSILSATKIITKVVEPKIKVIEGSLQPIIKTEGKKSMLYMVPFIVKKKIHIMDWFLWVYLHSFWN